MDFLTRYAALVKLRLCFVMIVSTECVVCAAIVNAVLSVFARVYWCMCSFHSRLYNAMVPLLPRISYSAISVRLLRIGDFLLTACTANGTTSCVFCPYSELSCATCPE